MANSLKLVIAARHGLGLGNTLSEPGIQQSKNLGEAIKRLTHGKRIEIFTSPIARAFETARMIQDITVATSLTTCESLKKGGFVDGILQLEEITELLTDGGEVIVAISHNEALSGIIHAASMFISTSRLSYPCCEIKHGEALVLDIKTGIVTRIPYNEPIPQR